MNEAPNYPKVAVTAATGGLGRLVVEELIKTAGQSNVIAVARDPSKADFPSWNTHTVETRKADYASVDDLVTAFAGVDTVVFVSSPVGVGDRVQLHRNVIEAGKQAGVRKMIYTSVIGNGDELQTLYAPMAQLNRQTEKDLQDSGMEWVVGRNGLYLEFDVAHILNAEAEGVFRNNGGEGYCCYITRNELARAFAAVALSDHCNGRALNFVGEAYRQEDLVELVNNVAGTAVRYEAIDDDATLAKIAPVRGEEVAAMLTGCYQAIRNGSFDVASDMEDVIGTCCKPIQFMVAEVVAAIRAADKG